MYRFYVDDSQISLETKRVTITGSDVNHIKNVLRMKEGEEISVSNGKDGRDYRCGILELDDERILCELRFIKEDGVELPARIHLFQALPKGDKMEFIIQKAVELGAYSIIPVETKRCVVKLDEKRAKNKVQRWQGIAEAAAKQSKRDVIPQVSGIKTFGEAINQASGMDVKIIPYELADGMAKTKEILSGITKGQDVAIFIGPEGGFDESEVEKALSNGIEPITLGKRILRTETAGMTVLSIIMYLLEE
ncbi:MAG: 16S rRNA (uracil(1498)-N(3))-methyltransferase [Lachnospiraceae bacterium]|nr:16S rRNA (uracil(1498)-N(3))-methyltransferase [Lachnospiraceae bacterium]